MHPPDRSEDSLHGLFATLRSAALVVTRDLAHAVDEEIREIREERGRAPSLRSMLSSVLVQLANLVSAGASSPEDDDVE